MLEFILYFCIFYFGACFGSFLTMASYRVPKGEDIVFKRSYCPICKKQLRVSSLFPIFSWLFQGGKCSNCGCKISIRYPLIELITATGFLLTYFFTNNLNIYHQIYFYLLFLLCMLISIVDIETYEIPYTLQIIFAIFGLIHIFFLKKGIFIHLLSSVLYFLIFYMMAYFLSKYKNADAIGGGDLGIVTGIGLFLGLNNINIFLFLSGVFGLIFGIFWNVKLKKNIFPFGASLLLSFLITFVLNNYYNMGSIFY